MITLGALTMDWISSELMRRVRSEFVSSDRGSLYPFFNADVCR